MADPQTYAAAIGIKEAPVSVLLLTAARTPLPGGLLLCCAVIVPDMLCNQGQFGCLLCTLNHVYLIYYSNG